jgi:hypothetical protein
MGSRARASTTALAQTMSPRGLKSERWKAHHNLGYDESARVYIWEDRDHTARELEALRGVPITQACCGRTNAFAMVEDGEAVVTHIALLDHLSHPATAHQMWSRQSDSDACRGSPPVVLPFYPLSEHSVARISCSESHSAMITTDGELYTWGVGVDGRLGHGTCEMLEVYDCHLS